jgi:hypothetical protein
LRTPISSPIDTRSGLDHLGPFACGWCRRPFSPGLSLLYPLSLVVASSVIRCCQETCWQISSLLRMEAEATSTGWRRRSTGGGRIREEYEVSQETHVNTGFNIPVPRWLRGSHVRPCTPAPAPSVVASCSFLPFLYHQYRAHPVHFLLPITRQV